MERCGPATLLTVGANGSVEKSAPVYSKRRQMAKSWRPVHRVADWPGPAPPTLHLPPNSRLQADGHLRARLRFRNTPALPRPVGEQPFPRRKGRRLMTQQKGMGRPLFPEGRGRAGGGHAGRGPPRTALLRQGCHLMSVRPRVPGRPDAAERSRLGFYFPAHTAVQVSAARSTCRVRLTSADTYQT